MISWFVTLPKNRKTKKKETISDDNVISEAGRQSCQVSWRLIVCKSAICPLSWRLFVCRSTTIIITSLTGLQSSHMTSSQIDNSTVSCNVAAYSEVHKRKTAEDESKLNRQKYSSSSLSIFILGMK